MKYLSLIHPTTGFLTNFTADELKNKAILVAHSHGGKLENYGVIVESGRAFLNVQFKIGQWSEAQRIELVPQAAAPETQATA